MNRILPLFFALIAAVVITSCEYKTIEPEVIELPDDGEPISFSEQIEPIFQSKCASCHTGISPVLTAGSAYNSLISGGYIDTENPTNSIIYTQTSEGHPSGNAMLPAELALLLKWIEEGAENN